MPDQYMHRTFSFFSPNDALSITFYINFSTQQRIFQQIWDTIFQEIVIQKQAYFICLLQTYEMKSYQIWLAQAHKIVCLLQT